MRVDRGMGIQVLGMAFLMLSVAACGSSQGSSGGAPAGDEEDETAGSESVEEADISGGEEGSEEDLEDEACAYGCNDGLSCTEDACIDGKCVNELLAGACLHDGVCFGEFELHPTDPCLVCELTQWVGVPDGLVCDDGDPCSLDDACVGGVCTGAEMDCSDDQPCTDDTCSAESGGAQCVHTPNAESCDDGNPCTSEDACSGGICVGGAAACDDADPCTEDVCNGETGECTYTIVECDDDNSCTVDSCDTALGGCIFDEKADGESCQGANLCLNGDTCSSGQCVEGSVVEVCEDDGNPCTTDSCLPEFGCLNLLNDSSCDDGFDCTTGDQCIASVCAGNPTPACKSCGTVSISGTTLKATVMLLGESGYIGEGLDVDGNPETCSPIDCEAGIDNSLSVLASILNPALKTSIDSGQNAPLVEFKNIGNNSQPFDIAVYNGVPDPNGPFGCNVLEEVCDYLILPGSLKPNCKATMNVPNATLDGTTLSAGGAGTVLVMGLPLAPGEIQYMYIVGGRIEGQVTFAEDGVTITSMQGIVAGAVPKVALMESIATVTPTLFAPLSIEEVVALVDALVEEDIDLDGDGIFDAASVGIRLSLIPGNINGVSGE